MDPSLQAAGWAASAFCLLIFAMIVARVIRRRPQVIIDEISIEDRRNGVGPIPWEQIREISVIKDGVARYLTLKLADAGLTDSLLPSHERVWRRVQRHALSRWSRGSDLVIPLTGLNPGLNRAIETIRRIVAKRKLPIALP